MDSDNDRDQKSQWTALYPLGDWDRMGDHLQAAEVLARSLGDQHQLGRIATLTMMQQRATGDFDAASKIGQEALAIARTLGDRSIEVVAMHYLGELHLVRGEYSEAVTLLERNIGLAKLRDERLGTPVVLSAASEYSLGLALSFLGQFDEAVGHGEAAVRIAEETDHPFTLFLGLHLLGGTHLARGDFARGADPRAEPPSRHHVAVRCQNTRRRRRTWLRLCPCWPD